MGSLRFICIGVLALRLGSSACAASAETGPWDLEALSIAPKTFEDPERTTDDVKAIFYEGLPWKGRRTRVFAYYGLPAKLAGKKVPGIVLVHGGGGSAFRPWVRLWTGRGYAAIAMDTCGCISSGGYRGHPRHDHGGPPGWGGFDQLDQPIEDQWTYHAVADVILAHSLLRSFPQVDPERIGVTGVSWGGYLTCIVAGVDSRFKFAAPVYGCGFLGDNSAWTGHFQKMGKKATGRWLGLWDPSTYLPRARMPMLWVTGTNDFAYPMDSLQKSYRLPKAPRTLAIRLRMPHGHGGPGENPEEIHALGNTLVCDGIPLARITDRGREGSKAWVRFESRVPVIRAELNYTKDLGEWKDRGWQIVPATLDAKSGRVSAVLPKGVTVYYFNLVDRRDLVVSSEHEEVASRKQIQIPRVHGEYVHVYEPAGDKFPGPDEAGLKAGQFYGEWVPNDHCFTKAPDGRWHAFGITHPLTGVEHVHAGENQSFHAVAPPGELEDVLKKGAWKDSPKVLPPAERPGETRQNHAPYVVKRGDLYYMFYGPGPIRYATSKDLHAWAPRGELSRDPGGRDPSVLFWNDTYHLLVCGNREVKMATSRDLTKWTEAETILSMEGSVDPESPTMIRYDGTFYLFVCGWNGVWDKKDLSGAYQHVTYVYRSDNPLEFDAKKEVARLPAHAPEIFQGEDGNWYISSAEWPNRGVSIARLIWE